MFTLINNKPKPNWSLKFSSDVEVKIKAALLIRLPQIGDFKPGALFEDLSFVESRMNYLHRDSENNMKTEYMSITFWFMGEDTEGSVCFDIGTSIHFNRILDLEYDSPNIHKKKVKLYDDLLKRYRHNVYTDPHNFLLNNLIFKTVVFSKDEYNLFIDYLDVLDS